MICPKPLYKGGDSMSKEKLEAIRDITVAYIQTIIAKFDFPILPDQKVKYDALIYQFMRGLNEVLSEVETTKVDR
jgi:hypothetical protein